MPTQIRQLKEERGKEEINILLKQPTLHNYNIVKEVDTDIMILVGSQA